MRDSEAMQDAPERGESSISFGAFRLQPERQLLLAGESPVPIGGRAFDILVLLVDRAGQLVTKEELVERVWPGISVDESNLRAQVAALRRALGDGHRDARYVATVPGRGYRFVAPVVRTRTPRDPSDVARHARALPSRLTPLVGRAAVVDAIGERLRRRRFVTLVGTGGIGKSSTALAVADAVSPSYENGVCFVDLAPFTDARQLPIALASRLGLSVVSDDPTPGVIASLRDRSTLVVLDGCEHFVEASAVLAETILRDAPGAHLLATSREPLRADGESVHRLAPLEVPPDSMPPRAAEALSYSAVQLFAERVAACVDGFELSDAEAPYAAEICRRLDGLPLAIELAAGRVDAFGVRGVAERLDDRFRLLTRGRSTAPPRHQTLHATLDWSWELLREPERMVLRRLSVLSGSFSLEAAAGVAGDPALGPEEVADRIANLVAKSLVSADVSHSTGAYRLLDTTRAYAGEKLRESGELRAVSRRHAEECLRYFERGRAGFGTRSVAEWTASYPRWADDLRSALDWAFSEGGDPALGVSLTVATLPIGFQLSMMHECRSRVERALKHVPLADAGSAEPRMRLFAALGADLMQTGGSSKEIRATWCQALELAEELGDVDHQLRALWGLWACDFTDAEFRAALATAGRFREVARKSQDSCDLAVGERLIGIARFVLGDLAEARSHFEAMLARYEGVTRHSDIVRFVFDQRAGTRSVLASILWLQGFPDRAAALSRETLEDVLATGHGLSICNTLSDSACPLAMLGGDLDAAMRHSALLRETAASHSLDVWCAWVRCFDAVLLAQRHGPRSVVGELRAAFDGICPGAFHPRYATLLAALAEALGRGGDVDRARAGIDDTLEHCRRVGQGWVLAELLRVQGELARLGSDPRADPRAEECFLASIDDAHRRGALAWELRSATSLARLWRDTGRAAEGRERLAATLARFDEGFGTADLVAAAQLLGEPF
jgi:predicted ATPase/DNA-binding winged helix-turn-helix (wHTH) protein